jgi:uncharacterized protein YcaQ
MKTLDSISPKVRRCYILGKQGLWPGRRWTGKEGTATALSTVEGVQIDPVTIVAPSQDIVLWGRVREYQTEYLHDLLYKERRFFDYGGGLFIYPIDELPYWRVVMNRRKSEKRWAEFAQANPTMLNEVRYTIRTNGPLQSRDFEGNSTSHYRSSKETGVALYYLWLTGELMIRNRQGKERIYDFLENIAPEHLQWTASENNAVQFFVRKAVSHLGMVSERQFRNALKSACERPVDTKEAKATLVEMVESGLLTGVQCEHQTFYCLASDTHYLESLSNGTVPADWHTVDNNASPTETIFLSPLEYVSARGRAKELFDFDYIWEIYKPASKRQYGPYTMPILFGNQLVARIDAKLERQSQLYSINGLWFEKWFAPDNVFSLALAKGLHRFAIFLGVDHIDTKALNPVALQTQVNEYLFSNGILPG